MAESKRNTIDEWGSFEVGLEHCEDLWLPCCSFTGWQWFPVGFQEAIFPIHSYMFGEGSAVGAVKCKLQMTNWDWEQNEGCQSSAVLDLMKEDKLLKRGQNNVCYTEHAGILVGAHSRWTGKWLGKQNNVFMWSRYCLSDVPVRLQLLVVMKTNAAAHMLSGNVGFENVCITCAPPKYFWFHNLN